jgi:hypothetical protein
MKISKLISYSTNMCCSCQSTRGILVRSLIGLCGFFEFRKTCRFWFFKFSINQRTGGSSSSKNKFKIKESWVLVISNTFKN